MSLRPPACCRPLLAALVAVTAPLAPAPVAVAADPIPLFGDEVLARGKDLQVTRRELDDAVLEFKTSAAAQGQTVAQDELPVIEDRLLNKLVLTRLLLARATAQDRAEGKASAQKFIDDARQKTPSTDSYRRQLLALGQTPEKFEARVLEQAVCEAVLEREVKSQVVIAPEQVQAFYEKGDDAQTRELEAALAKLRQSAAGAAEVAAARQRIDEVRKANLVRLDQPDGVRVLHIMVYTIDKLTREPLPEVARTTRRDLMLKLRTRIQGGEDMSKLAREFSEDPDAQTTGGEYTAGRNTPMPPALKAAAFSLELNQLSDLIETPFGFHLLRLKEKLPARRSTLEEARKDIQEYLANQEVQLRLPGYVERMKKEAGVEVTGLHTGAATR